MANIYKGVQNLIGNTPLVEVTNIEKELGLEAKVLVKLEYFNPAGSVKDQYCKGNDRGCRGEGNPEGGFRYHRADLRKYRYRSCIDRSIQRISVSF